MSRIERSGAEWDLRGAKAMLIGKTWQVWSRHPLLFPRFSVCSSTPWHLFSSSFPSLFAFPTMFLSLPSSNSSCWILFHPLLPFYTPPCLQLSFFSRWRGSSQIHLLDHFYKMSGMAHDRAERKTEHDEASTAEQAISRARRTSTMVLKNRTGSRLPSLRSASYLSPAFAIDKHCCCYIFIIYPSFQYPRQGARPTPSPATVLVVA